MWCGLKDVFFLSELTTLETAGERALLAGKYIKGQAALIRATARFVLGCAVVPWD